MPSSENETGANGDPLDRDAGPCDALLWFRRLRGAPGLFRPLLKVRAASWYHVVDRGMNRSRLLPTPKARDRFVFILGEIAYGFAVELHAYCAMENHYHVLARGEESDLRRAFARLETGCSLTTEGARFRVMAFGRHMLHVTRYIHRNPVEAGLVPRPGDWPWSSYRGYLDSLATPPWLRTDAVLGLLGPIGGRQRYRHHVEGLT